MFISFIDALRRGGIQASLKEHLLLLEALDADVIAADPEQFYYLARSVFVHDESQIDRFDRRRIMIISQILWAASSVGLAVLSHAQGPIPLVYVLLVTGAIAHATGCTTSGWTAKSSAAANASAAGTPRRRTSRKS